MAKFKRFENGNPKHRERRREDYDAFDSHGRRKNKKFRKEKYDDENSSSHQHRFGDLNYKNYDDSEDI